jgi:hypothetical protein
MARNSNEDVTGWVGWVYFAGFMMIVLGIFQSIVGLTALLNDTFYVKLQAHLLVLDYTKWGWVHLLFGVLIIVVGSNLFSGKTWARVLATGLVTLNLIAQFAFVSVYPIWSIIMMIVDVLVIYALTVHGGEAKIDA